MLPKAQASLTSLSNTVSVVEIRQLDASDWRVWREVRLRALAEAPAAFGETLAGWSGDGDTESRWRARLDDVAANFVAYLDGKPVGQVAGACGDQEGRVALISMWVAPEARGAGVGNALIEAVESWALDAGAERLTLAVKVGNTPAIELYQRHGFSLNPVLADDGLLDMTRHLT